MPGHQENHCLGRRIRAHRDALDEVVLHPERESIAGEAHKPHGKVGDARRPCLAVDGQPHLGGYLRGELVEAQGGDEAHHALRDSLGHLYRGVMLRDVGTYGHIQAPRDPLDQPLAPQPRKPHPRHPERFQIARPHSALCTHDLEDLLLAIAHASHCRNTSALVKKCRCYETAQRHCGDPMACAALCPE